MGAGPTVDGKSLESLEDSLYWLGGFPPMVGDSWFTYETTCWRPSEGSRSSKKRPFQPNMVDSIIHHLRVKSSGWLVHSRGGNLLPFNRELLQYFNRQ